MIVFSIEDVENILNNKSYLKYSNPLVKVTAVLKEIDHTKYKYLVGDLYGWYHSISPLLKDYKLMNMILITMDVGLNIDSYN